MCYVALVVTYFSLFNDFFSLPVGRSEVKYIIASKPVNVFSVSSFLPKVWASKFSVDQINLNKKTLSKFFFFLMVLTDVEPIQTSISLLQVVVYFKMWSTSKEMVKPLEWLSYVNTPWLCDSSTVNLRHKTLVLSWSCKRRTVDLDSWLEHWRP